MSSKDIADLDQYMQPLCEQFLAQCASEGLEVKIIFTYRSPAEQDKIYAQGRTAPGKKVTNLDGRHSKHCAVDANGDPAAKAFDFGIYEEDGTYVTNGDDPRYLQAGEIGEALGMTWGGRWTQPHDAGHLQIT
jgi:peptidoglycan L-alanyl-D-glutamate endopeptidase CwlK